MAKNQDLVLLAFALLVFFMISGNGFGIGSGGLEAGLQAVGIFVLVNIIIGIIAAVAGLFGSLGPLLLIALLLLYGGKLTKGTGLGNLTSSIMSSPKEYQLIILALIALLIL